MTLALDIIVYGNQEGRQDGEETPGAKKVKQLRVEHSDNRSGRKKGVSHG